MRTPGVPQKLQKAIRDYYKNYNWLSLAHRLDITLKSVQYQLNAELGREVTFNFIGLLAVNNPEAWKDIERVVYGHN